MGTVLPGSLNKICIEEVDFGSPSSEAVMTKISANINALINRQWRIDTFTAGGTWECPNDINSGASQSSAFIFVLARGGSGGGGGGAGGAAGGNGTATLFDDGDVGGLEIQFPGGLGGEDSDTAGFGVGNGRHFMSGEEGPPAGGIVGGDFEDFARNAPVLAGRSYPPLTSVRDIAGVTDNLSDTNSGVFLARVLSTRNFTNPGTYLNYSLAGVGGGGTRGGGSGTPTFDVSVIQPGVAPGVVYPITIGTGGAAGVGGAPAPTAGTSGELKILYYSASAANIT
jgi:hypothetical protein